MNLLTLADLTDLKLPEIERNLDNRKLCVEMSNGKWWAVRRNGATKTWKTRLGHFRIPVKAGLRSCGYISHDCLASFAAVADLDAAGVKHT